MMALLEIEQIFKRFGGNSVLNGVSFNVGRGEIASLIGPNGAGKTTLFDIISGISRPDSGGIKFDGRKITKLHPYQICKAGIARTFQIAKPIGGMTVLQNVAVASLYGARRSPNMKDAIKNAYEILEFVGLAGKANRPVESLTIADVRRLELARSVGCEPKLILSDEVLAGLTPEEIGIANKLIKKINKELDMTILMVEHVMSAVMNVSDVVNVLHQGKIICRGKPKEVARDERTIEAYLGRE